MKKLIAITAIISTVLYSCAPTIVNVQNPQELKGKKIGIAYFNLVENFKGKRMQPSDTICTCISEFIVNNLTPYLKQSGMEVVRLSELKKTELAATFEKADSLKTDYVLFGSGRVYSNSKRTNTHIEILSFKLIDVKTREVAMTASSNASLSSKKQISKMGKKIIALMK